MKHLVIQNADKSETQIVRSLDGHEGWTLVGEHRGAIEDACRFDTASKRLTRCARTHERRQREHQLRDPAALLDRVERLEIMLASRGQQNADASTP